MAHVKFACVLFDHKQDQVVLEGQISTDKFQKWFKQDYAVEGERLETPSSASVFGALVLTNGEEILVMPLCSWGTDQDRYFACQSNAIGKAPMFCVLEQSQKDFLAALKSQLGKLAIKRLYYRTQISSGQVGE